MTPRRFTAAIEHRIETRVQERTDHLEPEIAEREATIETLQSEETADQDDEADSDPDLVTDGGTPTVALEIRADDPNNYDIDDLWIDDIPIGTLIKRSHETSKANKQTIEDTTDDIESHGTAIRHLNSVVGTDASNESAASDSETTTRQPRDTPLEQLLDDPQRSGIRITESVTRALSIAGHYKQWSNNRSAGHVIIDGLKELLSTAMGEQLAWKQVHRACHKLDELTHGKIQFKDHHRHGRILVVEDTAWLSRVVSDQPGR